MTELIVIPAIPMSKRDKLATTLAFIVAIGALCYLAPLEYGAAIWLGLPSETAWTLTTVIEGFLALSITVGRWVPFALTLTWSSATLGQGHAAGVLTNNPDWYMAGSSLVVTSIMVAALAGTHELLIALSVRRSDQAERERANAERERERRERTEREQREQRERANTERANAERAERERVERTNAENERARTFAEYERTKLWNAGREIELQAEVRKAELQVEATRAAAMPVATKARQVRSTVPKASSGEREVAYKEWLRRLESGEPMSNAELRDALGCTDSAARGIKARWTKALAESAN